DGAVVAKNVALATVVLMIARCQTRRSPVKARPASMVAGGNERRGAPAGARASSILIQTYSTGSARLTRQKALANGPTPAALATRTKSGEMPIATAPVQR